MDGISAAASILGIATAGIQISIKLVSFSNQIGTAPGRIRLIGNDVSLTAGVLQQLGDLMHQQGGDEKDDRISIFSEGGLLTTRASATTCKSIFEQLEEALMKASRQIRESGASVETGKVFLSAMERLRFPFFQPNLDTLRGELRDARGTLLLILQVTTLAYSKKLAELNHPTILNQEEQAELMRSILAMHREKKRTTIADPEGDDVIVVEHNSIDQGVDGDVIPPSNNDMPMPIGEKDLPDDRETPDLSKEDPKKETSKLPAEESKGSNPEALHDSVQDSASPPIKRPRVCKFPWSSDGKNGRSSRSRDRHHRGLPRRGRRRSSTSSMGTIIRIRSRSADSLGNIVKEAWIVSPSVQSMRSSYRVCWIAERLPLVSDDVEEEHERLKRKNKKSVAESMVRLTNNEREFLDEWFSDELAKQNVKLFVVAIAIEKIKAPELVITNLPKRRIRLIIERHPTDVLFGRPISPGQRPQLGPGVISSDRPTFLKVHKKFMEPEVLNRAKLPWEWDLSNPKFMIIKRWLPETETEQLFEETRRLRRGRGDEVFKENRTNPNRRLKFPWQSKRHGTSIDVDSSTGDSPVRLHPRRRNRSLGITHDRMRRLTALARGSRMDLKTQNARLDRIQAKRDSTMRERREREEAMRRYSALSAESWQGATTSEPDRLWKLQTADELDHSKEEGEGTGQDIIDGLIGKFTTLFDRPGPDGTETKTDDGT